MSLSLKPEHLRRYRDLARLLVRYSGDVDLSGSAGVALEEDPDDPPPAAESLADDLEALGPTFIKLGQLLSTRPDILPPSYLTPLARLQDRCEPVAWGDVRSMVETELERPIERAFATFEQAPLAAASLGQVHRATLPDGRLVAVKVQRPGIKDQIVQDLDALAEVAGFLDRRTEAGRRFGFEAMLEEFRRSMLGELDYRAEAENLKHLADSLVAYDLLVVPQPVDALTTERVLTMEYVDGRRVEPVPYGRELADQLFRAYLHQVLEDGFFHADPHPGNVFLTEDGRLALIDLGMVARIPAAMQDRLLKLLLAASEGRGDDVAEVAMELGEKRESFDPTVFCRRVSTLVTEQHGRRLEQVAAGAVVVELTRIAGESGLRPASELVMLGKALLNLDEVARTLDPAFDPNEAIRDEAATILRNRLLQAVSPGNLLSATIEAKEFVEKLPGRVNKVVDALAAGELKLNIQGIDERELMRGIQKLANRVTMGLLLAALIIGAAMLVRVPTTSTLFGYPAIAIVCFLLAAAGAFALLLTIVLGDRR